jgi:hypothetical protein
MPAMSAHRVMAVLLLALLLLALVARITQGTAAHTTLLNRLAWEGYLFGLPLLLSWFLLAGARWALMGGVIYGTIGLALDISTVVQLLSHAEALADSPRNQIVMSGLTGLLNGLLILFGGRGFLNVGPAGAGSDVPRADPPPNPPSQPSA